MSKFFINILLAVMPALCAAIFLSMETASIVFIVLMCYHETYDQIQELKSK
jgi:hypothetical protein